MATKSLALADELRPIVSLVVDGLTSEHSRRAYGRALTDFLTWYDAEGRPGLSKALVQRYKVKLQGDGLAPASINQRLSAIRKLAQEAADNALLDPHLAAGIGRVQGVRNGGRRAGNWLTKEQAQDVLNAPDVSTLKGLRDRAILAVLLGCGLRRSEVAALTVEHVQQREARWCIVDLLGKRNKVRTVPMPSWCKTAIDAWTQAAGITEGRLFRAIGKGGAVNGDSMTAQAIADVVKEYAPRGTAAHDLRRTWAKLAYAGGARLDQISLALGHESLETTAVYLGLDLDLSDAACDHLGLKLEYIQGGLL